MKVSNKAKKLMSSIKKPIAITEEKEAPAQVLTELPIELVEHTAKRVELARPASESKRPPIVPEKIKPVVKSSIIIELSPIATKRLESVDKEAEIEKVNLTIEIEKLKVKFGEIDKKSDARKLEICQGEMEASGISYVTPILRITGDYKEIEVADLSVKK
jgi:hypothetical protein